MVVRLLLAPCCHDTIDLDPPDTEYLMITVMMETHKNGEFYSLKNRPEDIPNEPMVACVPAEQPYHVECLKAGRGLRTGVSWEQISVPGPLGTRRFAKRSELEG